MSSNLNIIVDCITTLKKNNGECAIGYANTDGPSQMSFFFGKGLMSLIMLHDTGSLLGCSMFDENLKKTDFIVTPQKLVDALMAAAPLMEIEKFKSLLK